MGGILCKNRGKGVHVSESLPRHDSSQYRAELSSYAAACKADAELKTIDHALHDRTNRVINTLAMGMELRSLSFDSLREVTGSLLQMNQDVVRVILEHKKDIWKNKELRLLVEDYFESSLQTLDFCNALEMCLRRARDSQLIIKFAVHQFDEEKIEDGVEGQKYVKTLQELQKFKAIGDPFTEEFFAQFRSVYEQQQKMLQKLHAQRKKLDRKIKSAKAWRKVSNVIFVTAFLSVLIFSVVAAAVAAPPVVTALAGAMAVPLGSVGKWCNHLWNNYLNELKRQKVLASKMHVKTFITIIDMQDVKSCVNKLEIQIESLLQTVDFALIDEEVAVKFAIDEINKKLEVFTEAIEDLAKQADKCSQDINKARTAILDNISRLSGD